MFVSKYCDTKGPVTESDFPTLLGALLLFVTMIVILKPDSHRHLLLGSKFLTMPSASTYSEWCL